ncbi:Ribonuclease II [uncultured virus]|nr:Ribonuclease II [uncultured virus]
MYILLVFVFYASIGWAGEKPADPANAAPFLSLHGAWPEYDNGSYPERCRPVEWSDSELDGLRPQLDYYWRNMWNADDTESLWRHEMTVHGSCTDCGQRGFFEAVLGARAAASNVTSIFEHAIPPSDDAPFATEQLREALDELGIAAFATCAPDVYQNEQLTSLVVCLDFEFGLARGCTPAILRMQCNSSSLYVHASLRPPHHSGNA